MLYFIIIIIIIIGKEKKLKITLLTGFGTIIIHEERRNRNVKISILLGVNRFNFFFRFQALVNAQVIFEIAQFCKPRHTEEHCNFFP